MVNKIVAMLVIILGAGFVPYTVMAQVDCSVLDPRASVSKEREGKIIGSVDTLYRIAKAGGSMEGKVKEEIQNLQKGAPVDEKNLIKLRTVYLFCGMFANDKDLAPERKVALFNLMMGITQQGSFNSGSNNENSQNKSPTRNSKNAPMAEKNVASLEVTKIVRSDFLAYETYRLRVGNSFGFFIKMTPLHYRIWRKEAEQGNAMAQVLVGRALTVGDGVPEDWSESIKWFERAADQGNPSGQFNLCNSYLYGLGVPNDEATAFTFCEQAASHNQPGAIRIIGEFYRWGYAGKRIDLQTALKWYQQASNLGDTGAMVETANLYWEGAPGVSPNTQKAKQLYSDAASLGNEAAKGILSANEITEQLERYASDLDVRESSLKTIKLAIQKVDDIDVIALINALNNFKVRPVIEKILTSDSSDPMLPILSDLLNHLIERFRFSNPSTRAVYLRNLSQVVHQNVKNLVDSEKYVDVAHACRDIYKGLDLTKHIEGEQDFTVKLLNSCINSLFAAGYRDDAIALTDNASRMIQAILKERPWDWYLIDAAGGLYWEVGASLQQLNDREHSQQYLSLAWNLFLNRLGRSDLIGKYQILPIKGELPPDVRDEDRDFFKSFATGNKDKKKDNKSGFSKLTVSADFNGTEFPFEVYIMSGKQGYKGLQDQFVWLKEYRGGKISNAVQDRFRKLNKIAVDNDVDFRAVCLEYLAQQIKND